MIIYVVTEGSYSDYRIMAVFENKEKAYTYAAIRNDKYYDDCVIEEYDTDAVVLEANCNVMQRWHFSLYDSDLRSLYSTPTTKQQDDIKQRGKYIFGYIVTNIDVSEEHAKKIIFDKIAEWKAGHLL